MNDNYDTTQAFDVDFSEGFSFSEKTKGDYEKRSLEEVTDELKNQGKEKLALKLKKITLLYKFRLTIDDINYLSATNSIKPDEYTDIVHALSIMEAIDDDALGSLIVPEGVLELPPRFLTFLNSLVQIVLPKSLLKIDDSALAYNKNLRQIFIPENVCDISGNAFLGCRNLSSILVDTNNKNYAGSGYVTNKKGTKLIVCPENYFPTLEIDSTFREFEDEYPEFDDPLFGPIFSDSKIMELGEYSMFHCKFDELRLPALKSIGAHALEHSNRLRSIKSRPIEFLGPYSLSECVNLTDIDISCVKELPDHCFYSDAKLKEIRFSDELTSIGASCFEDCFSLTEISPINAANIGENCFLYTNIWRAQLNNISTIGNYCFCKCQNLSSVSISGNIKEIPYDCFGGCTVLQTVMLPDSVEILRANSFCRCENLLNIQLPSNLMTIEDSVFEGCDSLQSVTIGKSVKSIANSAFGTLIADCTELTSIDVEDGNEHFVSVNGVLLDADKTTVIKYPSNKPEESYTIADSVEKVEEDALLSDNLKKIYIGSGVKEIDWIHYLNNRRFSL
ncbi:MAG: leucine-rich repeat protein [Acutalibacteraceae bacterium]